MMFHKLKTVVITILLTSAVLNTELIQIPTSNTDAPKEEIYKSVASKPSLPNRILLKIHRIQISKHKSGNLLNYLLNGNSMDCRRSFAI